MNLTTQAKDFRTLSAAYFRRAAADGPDNRHYSYNRSQAMRFEDAALAIEGAIWAANARQANEAAGF